MSRVASARIGPVTFGSTSSRSERRRRSRAAVRSPRIRARARPAPGRPGARHRRDRRRRVRRARALVRFAPSAAATTMARITVGKAKARSANRMIVSSTQLPEYPAQAPGDRRSAPEHDQQQRQRIDRRAPYVTLLRIVPAELIGAGGPSRRARAKVSRRQVAGRAGSVRHASSGAPARSRSRRARVTPPTDHRG